MKVDILEVIENVREELSKLDGDKTQALAFLSLVAGCGDALGVLEDSLNEDF